MSGDREEVHHMHSVHIQDLLARLINNCIMHQK